MTHKQIEQAQMYAKEHGDDVIEDDKLEVADLRRFTEWIPVPRDRSGFVEWDMFHLPPAEAYLYRTDNEDLIPYETTYEFTSESQMNHILAVLPIPLYQTKEGDR